MSVNPYAPPQAKLQDRAEAPDPNALRGLGVSDPWKNRFAAIHQAGGAGLPELSRLPWRQRISAIRPNPLALLFGPFYYIAKGMWRRAVTLFGGAVAIAITTSLALDYFGFHAASDHTNFLVAFVFSFRANLDYYKKIVNGDNGWL